MMTVQKPGTYLIKASCYFTGMEAHGAIDVNKIRQTYVTTTNMNPRETARIDMDYITTLEQGDQVDVYLIPGISNVQSKGTVYDVIQVDQYNPKILRNRTQEEINKNSKFNNLLLR